MCIYVIEWMEFAAIKRIRKAEVYAFRNCSLDADTMEIYICSNDKIWILIVLDDES